MSKDQDFDEQNTDMQADMQAEQNDEVKSSPQQDDLESMSDDDVTLLDTDELAAEVEKLAKENQALKDNFLRAKAEAENITRRTQNEINNVRKFAIEGFAKELLSVLDSLDQAAKVELGEDHSDVTLTALNNMREGLELTNKQLATVLEKFGVAEVEAGAGVKFDPDSHQAISMVPGSDVASGHIIDVMQKGYSLNERLLRPAMVIVAQ